MNVMPVGNVLQKDHLYEQVADLLEQQILNNYEDGSKIAIGTTSCRGI